MLDARALFERGLASLDSSSLRRLWDRFLDYEYEVGDLESMDKLFRRYEDFRSGGDGDAVSAVDFAKRYSFETGDYLCYRELGLTSPSTSTTAAITASSVGGGGVVTVGPTNADMSAGGRRRVYLPATKEEDLRYPPVKRALGGVKHSARRPNLSFMTEFNAETAIAAANAFPVVDEIVGADKAASALPTENAANPESLLPTIAELQALQNSLANIPALAFPAVDFSGLPPAVQAVLSMLPPATAFLGPQIPPHEIVHMLQAISLPPPHALIAPPMEYNYFDYPPQPHDRMFDDYPPPPPDFGRVLPPPRRSEDMDPRRSGGGPRKRGRR